jgi:putative endonuclease
MAKYVNTQKGYRQRVGRGGEEEAARFLTQKGYRILERNFRAERGEIDLVAIDGNSLVFIEVKTKAKDGFGEPEDWVSPKKQRQIGKVAMAYLQKHGLEDADCRFDVIAITHAGTEKRIHHIEDAFWLDTQAKEDWL